MTFSRTILLLQLMLCATLGLAIDISGKISWNDVCSNLTTLGQAKASLNNDIYRGGIRADGSFVIPGVPDGVHVLSIISHDFVFDQLRIDVNGTTVTARPYIPGTPLNPPSDVLLSYPVTLAPKEKANYFVPPESFNLTGMLANPMMLLMVFGGVLMLAMPYIINNMDPEALEEFKAQQQKIGGVQAALQGGDIKAGLSALASVGEQGTSTPANKPANVPKARGNKKSKR